MVHLKYSYTVFSLHATHLALLSHTSLTETSMSCLPLSLSSSLSLIQSLTKYPCHLGHSKYVFILRNLGLHWDPTANPVCRGGNITKEIGAEWRHQHEVQDMEEGAGGPC